MKGGAEEADGGRAEAEEEADIGGKSERGGVKNKLNSDKCIDREGQRSHSARRRPDGGPGPCSKWSAAVGQAEGK